MWKAYCFQCPRQSMLSFQYQHHQQRRGGWKSCVDLRFSHRGNWWSNGAAITCSCTCFVCGKRSQAWQHIATHVNKVESSEMVCHQQDSAAVPCVSQDVPIGYGAELVLQPFSHRQECRCCPCFRFSIFRSPTSQCFPSNNHNANTRTHSATHILLPSEQLQLEREGTVVIAFLLFFVRSSCFCVPFSNSITTMVAHISQLVTQREEHMQRMQL